MTIADSLTELLATKQAIKAAIEEKGVSVPDTELISSYSAYIDQIEVSNGPDPNNPTLENLKLALATDDPASIYPVGTEIDDTWDGKYNPLIVAHYTDIPLADGTTKSGAYLVRKFVDPTSIRFNSNNWNDYQRSDLKTYLDTTYLEKCSSEMKENVAEIQVKYASTGGASQVNGKFFPMSATEVLALATAIGEPWDLWKQKTGLSNNSIANNAGRIGRAADSSAAAYWLRDYVTYRDYSGQVSGQGFINLSGALIASQANVSMYVLPACAVIGKPSELQLLKESLNAGTAETVYPVGTEIADTWNDGSSPLIVVDYGSATLSDGTSTTGVYLMRKYTSSTAMTWPTNVSYDNAQISTYLQDDYYEKCSTSLKELIADIKVDCVATGTATLTTVNQKVFLPSGTNVNSAYIGTDLGSVWSYFREKTGLETPVYTANAGRIPYSATGQAVTSMTRATSTDGFNWGVAVIKPDGSLDLWNVVDIDAYIQPACFIARNATEATNEENI